MSAFRPGAEATGAVASAGCLYVASIMVDAAGRIRLVKSRSGEVRLHERSQQSLQMFTSFLDEFLKRREIGRLMLMGSPEAGTHMAHASTYKIEAALQLMPIAVDLVASSAVTVFAKNSDTSPPGPDHERLGREQAKAQSRAILAALYRLHAEQVSYAAAAGQASSSGTDAAESPEQALVRTREEERRRAVAEKSQRARDRQAKRRFEAQLEVRAAAALKEQLEFEEEQRRKGVRPKRMSRVERIDAEMRAQYEKETAAERKAKALERLRLQRAHEAEPEEQGPRHWIHEI